MSRLRGGGSLVHALSVDVQIRCVLAEISFVRQGPCKSTRCKVIWELKLILVWRGPSFDCVGSGLCFHPNIPGAARAMCPAYKRCCAFFALGRFNANLYSDGKVCLSVLGKDSGSGTAGSGDYWNPDTSSLWQVIGKLCSGIQQVSRILLDALSRKRRLVQQTGPESMLLGTCHGRTVSPGRGEAQSAHASLGIDWFSRVLDDIS